MSSAIEDTNLFLDRSNFTGNHHAGNHFFRAGVVVSGHCILCFHLITFYHEKNLSIKGKSLFPYGHITAIKSALTIERLSHHFYQIYMISQLLWMFAIFRMVDYILGNCSIVKSTLSYKLQTTKFHKV
ncbi:hypothetical protein P8452_60883 [Trifolium repens]|nr:hypothetical protein P8452_60883 [Trifolium repens]